MMAGVCFTRKQAELVAALLNAAARGRRSFMRHHRRQSDDVKRNTSLARKALLARNRP
jgi:hypothetical protein